MPGFSGTGPQGMGPRTGGGRGGCPLPTDQTPNQQGQPPVRQGLGLSNPLQWLSRGLGGGFTGMMRGGGGRGRGCGRGCGGGRRGW